MTKYWAVGTVKTRLGAAIGMEASADLHRVFTDYLCQSLRQSAHRRELCIAPDDRIPDVAEQLTRADLHQDWGTASQGQGDLGARMSRWFTRNLADHGCGILIGADHPTLPRESIDQTTELLIRHDVVLGPAADGGYYLIGLRGPWKESYQPIFREMNWSQPDVFDVTIKRIEQAGLSCGLLPVGEDVDTVVELKRLIQRIRQSRHDHRQLLSAIDQVCGTLDFPESDQ